jgi:hypothetical protein
MRESPETIRKWMEEKKAEGDTYMLLACDTFDYEQYPIGVTAAEFWTQYNLHHGKNMQRIEGVYDLARMEAITAQGYPPKPKPPMTEREALEEVRRVLLDPNDEHIAVRANKALNIIDTVLGEQK